MKTWVTLFDTYDTHLTKDVGAIPYGMQKFYDYNAYVTKYNSGEMFDQLENNLCGLKTMTIKRVTGKFNVDACLFLLKYAKKIDVLNVYHISSWPAVHVWLYKIRNYAGGGKVYLKCDCTASGFLKKYASMSKGKRFLYKKLFAKADVISSECEESRKLLEKEIGRAVTRIPNPVLDIRGYLKFEDRENRIITVGRLGTEQKATEILIKAFCEAFDGCSDWNLRLIGSVQENFMAKIKNVLEHYPDAAEHITFTGAITERKKLCEEYLKAKIVCMPSRSESFGIAFLEGGATGNFLIGTPLDSFSEITNGWRYGKCFPKEDVQALAGLLRKYCRDEKALKTHGRQEYEYVQEHYSLERITRNLEEALWGSNACGNNRD